MNKQKIILTGGGTAGHITPNLALIPLLDEYELHYIGRPNSMEEELIKKNAPHVTFHTLECAKLQRKFTLKNLLVPFKLLKSKKKARQLVHKIKPCAVFSKGGYVALPVMLAAKGVPLVLHESDYSMGLANKLGIKKCSAVCTSFSGLANAVKNGVHTGAPLRAEIYKGDKSVVEKQSGLSGRINLLIMGGSSGARAINNAVYKILPELLERFDVIHITGKQGEEDKLNTTTRAKKNRYYPIPYAHNIADYLAWADLCVTRGGANALFELVALAIPSLVIPLPKGASRGDQLDNAAYFERMGCVKVLPQEILTDSPSALLSSLLGLRHNRSNYITACKKQQHIDGTKQIAKILKAQAQQSTVNI
jgi:UDP-N-acetylglucosamine--N-acetylmuramyl-(pentapeptide) pyrophosphoryl-undecaprenol N-acetylglucosamine transferase